MSENIIEIKHLSKAFGEHKVLKDIDFSVKKLPRFNSSRIFSASLRPVISFAICAVICGSQDVVTRKSRIA